MKNKLPGKANPRPLDAVVDDHLREQVHEYLDRIVQYGECPSQWPLTQSEQIAFVRSAIYMARKITKSEEYLAEAVEMAARNMALVA